MNAENLFDDIPAEAVVLQRGSHLNILAHPEIGKYIRWKRGRAGSGEKMTRGGPPHGT
jgi:hypothetical protein